MPTYARDFPTLLSRSFSDIDQLLDQGSLTSEEYQALLELYLHPVALNRADTRLLMDLPFIDHAMARDIIAARKTLSRFSRVEQLQTVTGIGPFELSVLRLFVYVEPEKQTAGTHNAIQSSHLSVEPYRDNKPQATARPPGVQSVLSWKADYNRYNAEMVLSRRLRASGYYDEGTGLLTSEGPENQFDLERLSLYHHDGDWGSWVLGHFNAGFGQRVTFDTTRHAQPRGFSLRPAYSPGYDTGRFTVTPALFGAAYQTDFQIGSHLIQTHVFASGQTRDLYQYDFRYGPDAWLAPLLEPCTVPQQTTAVFECDDQLRWFTYHVADADNPLDNYNSMTLKDVVRENLAGTDLSWQRGAHQIGLIFYSAEYDFRLPLPDIRFSPGARYPEHAALSATGVHYRYDGPVEIAAEISGMPNGGRAYYARMESRLTPKQTLELALHHTTYRFENPYSRGDASNPNDQGVRLRYQIRAGALNSTSQVEWTQRPYVLLDNAQWERDNDAPTDLIMQQRFLYAADTDTSFGMLLGWKNKDIAANGRNETYASGDDFGRGERRFLIVNWDQFLPRGALNVQYGQAWEDVARLAHRFDTEQQYGLTYDLPFGTASKIRFSTAYWQHQVSYTGVYTVDRERPYLNTSVTLQNRLSQSWDWRARVGFLRFHDDRPDRFDKYITAYLSVSYETK